MEIAHPQSILFTTANTWISLDIHQKTDKENIVQISHGGFIQPQEECIELEGTMLSDRNQTQKDNVICVFHLWNIDFKSSVDKTQM